MFSIVIPAKNEERYLPGLLDSIQKQSLRPERVIVADAHSTDRTRQISQKFGSMIVDGGCASVGRNRGAQRVQTTFIVFLDADVELHDPDFFQKAFGEMLERKLDLATCDILPLSQQRIDHLMHKAYNMYARAWDARLAHAPGSCLFVRRAIHERVGGFDESIQFCEDHEYARRITKIGRFGFLRGVKLPISTRRFMKDGRFTTAMKYTLAEVHLSLLGPIRDDRFRYDFGYEEEKTK